MVSFTITYVLVHLDHQGSVSSPAQTVEFIQLIVGPSVHVVFNICNVNIVISSTSKQIDFGGFYYRQKSSCVSEADPT